MLFGHKRCPKVNDKFIKNSVTAEKLTQSIRKLIEAVREEIGAMSHGLHTDFHTDYSETQRLQGRLEGYNAAISDIGLKLKEIISSLEK